MLLLLDKIIFIICLSNFHARGFRFNDITSYDFGEYVSATEYHPATTVTTLNPFLISTPTITDNDAQNKILLKGTNLWPTRRKPSRILNFWNNIKELQSGNPNHWSNQNKRYDNALNNDHEVTSIDLLSDNELDYSIETHTNNHHVSPSTSFSTSTLEDDKMIIRDNTFDSNSRNYNSLPFVPPSGYTIPKSSATGYHSKAKYPYSVNSNLNQPSTLVKAQSSTYGHLFNLDPSMNNNNHVNSQNLYYSNGYTTNQVNTINSNSIRPANVQKLIQNSQQTHKLSHYHIDLSQNIPGIIDLSGASVCGRAQVTNYREPRIVGGNSTYVGEFPWAVSIQRHKSHHCGGVIVGKRWILTAAHCVRSQLVGNLLVRTGGQTLTRSLNSINSHLERDYEVEQIIMHGDFSRAENQSTNHAKPFVSANNADIALLKLRHDIQWNEFVLPICFPDRDSGNFSGHDATVIGWGKLNEKSEDFSNELQKVKVTIIDNKVCQNWFRQAGRDMIIDERLICAGFKNGGKDACHGDSGGPLLSKINGQFAVVGVVSTGIGCARPLLPGLYSRVSSYLDWIEGHVI